MMHGTYDIKFVEIHLWLKVLLFTALVTVAQLVNKLLAMKFQAYSVSVSGSQQIILCCQYSTSNTGHDAVTLSRDS